MPYQNTKRKGIYSPQEIQEMRKEKLFKLDFMPDTVLEKIVSRMEDGFAVWSDDLNDFKVDFKDTPEDDHGLGICWDCGYFFRIGIVRDAYKVPKKEGRVCYVCISHQD